MVTPLWFIAPCCGPQPKKPALARGPLCLVEDLTKQRGCFDPRGGVLGLRDGLRDLTKDPLWSRKRPRPPRSGRPMDRRASLRSSPLRRSRPRSSVQWGRIGEAREACEKDSLVKQVKHTLGPSPRGTRSAAPQAQLPSAHQEVFMFGGHKGQRTYFQRWWWVTGRDVFN